MNYKLQEKGNYWKMKQIKISNLQQNWSKQIINIKIN